MKIAVCLSGHPRSFKITAPSIKKVFGDADFFFSTWEDQSNHETLEVFKDNDMNLVAHEFVTEPIQISHERKILDDFRKSFPDFFILNQWFGVKRAVRLMQDFRVAHNKDYDIVVRCRFDLKLDFSIEQLTEVFVPGALNIVKASTAGSDQFSYGTTEIMEEFLSFEGWLRGYSTKFGNQFGFFASPLLRAFFLDQGIPVNIISLPLAVFRTDDGNPKTARENRTKSYIQQNFPDLAGVAWHGTRKVDHMKKPAPWDKGYYPHRPFFYRNGKPMSDD